MNRWVAALVSAFIIGAPMVLIAFGLFAILDACVFQ